MAEKTIITFMVILFVHNLCLAVYWLIDDIQCDRSTQRLAKSMKERETHA